MGYSCTYRGGVLPALQPSCPRPCTAPCPLLSCTLQEPASYVAMADAGPPGGDLEVARWLLLAGKQEDAAQRLLAVGSRLLAGASAGSGSVSFTPGSGSCIPSFSDPDVRALHHALNSLHPPALMAATWADVFCLACHLGGHMALSLGYAGVGAFLLMQVHVGGGGGCRGAGAGAGMSRLGLGCSHHCMSVFQHH